MKKLLVLAVLFMVGGFVSAYDGEIFISNQTGYTIYYVFASHVDASDWGDDRLGENILSDGLSVKLEFYDIPSSMVDISIEDEDGDTYTFMGIDIEAMNELVVTIDDLD